MRIIFTVTLLASICSISIAFGQAPIRLLYFNDAHEPDLVKTENDYLGGVSRMKSVIDSIKQTDSSAIVLFGGDLGGGTLSGKLYRGSVMVDFLNQLPVDIANFGQHDFDYGIENTQELVKNSAFKWITSNAFAKDSTAIEGSYPYIIHEVQDKKIGIIGLVDKVNTSSPRSGVIQVDLIEAAVHNIKKMGKTDFLIAITQMAPSLNKDLLTKCPEIDVVLTEETSQCLTQVLYPYGKPIIAGCGNMGQLVEVIISSDKSISIKIHHIHEAITPDPVFEEKVKSLNSYNKQKLSQVIYNLPEDFPLTRTKFANLIADAFRSCYNTHLGVMQGAGVRADILSREVTLETIYSVLPFENAVIPVELTGEEVLELIKTGISQDGNIGISGARIIGLEDKPQEIKLFINDEPIVPEATYTVAMSEYIAQGGGKFNKVPESRRLLPLEKTYIDSDILIEYLSRGERGVK